LEKPFIVERLKKIAELENINYESDAVLELIAEASTGGMRDAITLLEQAYLYSQGNITLKKIKELTGLLPTEIYQEILQNIIDKNPKKILEIVEEVVAQGYSFEDFQKGFVKAAESLLKAFYGIERNSFTHIASKFNEYQILFLLRVLKDMELDIKSATNPKIFVDFHLLRLTKIESELELIGNVNFIDTAVVVESPPKQQPLPETVSTVVNKVSQNLENKETDESEVIKYAIEKLKLREVADGSI
jgi:DNA polymerase-3 subunit gamma/tau